MDYNTAVRAVLSAACYHLYKYWNNPINVIQFVVIHAPHINPTFNQTAEQLFDKASEWDDGKYFVSFLNQLSMYRYQDLAKVKLFYTDLYNSLVKVCGEQSKDFVLPVDTYLSQHPKADNNKYNFHKTNSEPLPPAPKETEDETVYDEHSDDEDYDVVEELVNYEMDDESESDDDY